MLELRKNWFAFIGMVMGLALPGASLLAAEGSLVDCTRGQVLEGQELQSRLMGQPVRYAVYLPPDYHCSSRRYPVIYLLHGFTDQEWAWIQFGEVNVTADQEILAGNIPGMIIVMPDGGVSWYVNDYSGKVPWERMLVEEMIPNIDATYRTRPEREFRGVSGLSMGGYGSLMLAMRHPELFATCAAFSSGIRTDEEVLATPQERWDSVMGAPFGKGLAGKDRFTSHYREYNPLDLVKTVKAEDLKKVRYYIDCGDDDFLTRGNCALHLLMSDLKIPHEYRVRDGGHSWIYWRVGIRDGLRFMGESFNR